MSTPTRPTSAPVPNLSLTGARWVSVDVADDLVASIQERCALSPVAARCMAGRWPMADWERALDPSMEQLHDPYAMTGMGVALERLRKALRDRHHVRIITDYDVDGTTSSLILQAALRVLQPDAQVSYHIPSRFGEGYGLSVKAVEQAKLDGVDLIVTADIGVRAHVPVARAVELGVEVLICDHHLPAGADVPEAALVLCPPQRRCSYPNPYLAACGISLKVAQALLATHPKRDVIVQSMLKLAAIGTVADLVPLTSLENRAIVALGLRELNGGRHTAGLRALLEVSSVHQGQISEVDLGYRIGPRINAAGRVADANLVVQLLNNRGVEASAALAKQLDGLNTKRRDIQKRLATSALASLGSDPDPFVVVAGPEEDGWHRGVVGIVASRIKDEVHRPVAVVSIQGDRAVGSVRSVPSVHAVGALSSCADLLEKFGGHPAAAGFTVPTKHLDALRERLCAYVEGEGADLIPTRSVDVDLSAERLDFDLWRELGRLGPFGMGNPRPRLAVHGVRPFGVSVKAGGRLLKFLVPRPGGTALDAVWWGQAAQESILRDNPVDLLGNLEENVYRGRRTLQFHVEDARLSSGATARSGS